MAKAPQLSTTYALPTLNELADRHFDSMRLNEEVVEVRYQEYFAAYLALFNARDFDTRLLVARLSRGTVTLDECRLAAKFLAGKKKKPAHRPGELRIQLKRKLISPYIRELLRAHWRAADIVKVVQKHFGKSGLSRSAVYQLVQRQRKTLGRVPRAAILTLSSKVPTVTVQKSKKYNT
jgi:hypothetical protein